MNRLFLAIAAAITIFATVGCASTDYAQYASIHLERSKTEALRYDALANVARHSNDQATRVAAVVALAVAGGGGGGNGAGAGIAPPEDQAAKLAGKVVDAGVSLYSIRANTAVKLNSQTQGAANTDTTLEALGSLDVYRASPSK
jgi:hypothetical protein